VPCVEAGSNTSTVTLRVVRGDEKGSLKSERVLFASRVCPVSSSRIVPSSGSFIGSPANLLQLARIGNISKLAEL
jgi:hypothetical protein